MIHHSFWADFAAYFAINIVTCLFVFVWCIPIWMVLTGRTSHELARKLLEGPDLPAVVTVLDDGWGDQHEIEDIEVRVGVYYIAGPVTATSKGDYVHLS